MYVCVLLSQGCEAVLALQEVTEGSLGNVHAAVQVCFE